MQYIDNIITVKVVLVFYNSFNVDTMYWLGVKLLFKRFLLISRGQDTRNKRVYTAVTLGLL